MLVASFPCSPCSTSLSLVLPWSPCSSSLSLNILVGLSFPYSPCPSSLALRLPHTDLPPPSRLAAVIAVITTCSRWSDKLIGEDGSSRDRQPEQ